MSYLNTKTEQEIEKENNIIKNLDPIYFEQNSDIVQHILDQLPGDGGIDHLDGLTVKISGYHEAVDSRFNDLIRKSYSGFVKGLSQVYEIEKDLQHSATMCKSGKEYLNGVMKNLTSFGFILLEKHRRRELTKFMLHETQSFKDISQIAHKVDSLLNENQFSEALIFLNKYNQEISTYSAKYICIKDLASRFQSSVDAIIEKIDSNFVKVCHIWNEKEFGNIIDGYSRLHQLVRFREKIHLNFILNIDDLSKKIIKTELLKNFDRPDEVRTMKFTDMCENLKEDQYVPALLSLLNHLSDLMWSHYQMKNWILTKSQSKQGDEKNFYIDIFKLLYSNRKTMWNSIQSQIRHILNSFKPKFKIEEFLKVLDSINQFIEVGNEFSGEEANILKSIMKEKSLGYFQFFHKKRIDDLKTMLENETWHKMPLPNNFTVLDIKEFGVVMKLNGLNSNSNSNNNNNNNNNNSNNNSNNNNNSKQQVFSTIFKVTEQKQISLELKDHDIPFMNKFRENGNPFSSAESRRTLNEASGDQFDQQHESTNGTNQQTNSPLIASTTVNVLRFIGKYFQMMKVLQPLSYPIFTAISQLLEYYVYTVFTFFGSSTTSVFDDSSNVNPMLKKTMQRLKIKFSSNPSPSPGLGKLKNDNSKSPNLSNASKDSLSVTTPSVLSLSTPNLTVSNNPNKINGNGTNSNNNNNNNGDSFDDEISIQWVLPTLSEMVDLSQSKNLYGLENKIIGLESMMFLVEAIMEAQPLVMSLVPNEKSNSINNFYVETVSVVASLKNLCYKNITSQLLNLDNIQNLVTGIKWELKEAPTSESNNYISQIIIEFHRFTGYLDEISSRSGILTPKVKNLLWENTITFAMETLIDSYSKIKKCNNYGRNLMIMDLKKLQAGLESLTTIRPIPHIQHVDQYITAYYLPESDLFNLARDSEFTCKQVISIVNVCGHLKKNEKQKLINDLEDLEKQRKLENSKS